ncbi:adhesion G protein-coupled receptor F5-like [Danio aesculapii]|uniref:adhesion G protein-coupled receptor F5-like n=1 Tax=Danio aesculapii TaxID=1142201 RepID=UPI0024BF3F64|nr:adhesion G protein-coupled receptor F5-like [Danio aesculapii]
MSLKINEDFYTGLTEPGDKKYILYKTKIESAVEANYKNVDGFVKGTVKVTGFRPGSIIADYTIGVATASSPSIDAFVAVNQQVATTLRTGDPSFNIPADAFSQSEEKKLSSADWYPQQDMELQCTRPPSFDGPMSWTVNDKPTTDTTKYILSNNNSILTVRNINKFDKGRYACIIARAVPYIQWQDISIKPTPVIDVGANVRNFGCVNQNINLTCCEQSNNPVDWTTKAPDDVVTTSVDGCATLIHAIKTGECGDIDFKCSLKDPALQKFNYGSKSVTVKLKTGELMCKNVTLGDGANGDITEGPCYPGMEGTITYKCQNSKWEVETDKNCVLKVFKDLEKKSEALQPQDIPDVVSQLSVATVNNNQVITQSPVTVQTIVNILTHVATQSQTVVISEPIMKNFLTTVNVLVSEESINSWQNLTSNDTSATLLSAVEQISSRLTEGNFTISETVVELNRTVITSEYIGTSSVPNSTTQILIPQVLNPTSLTVIVFSTLKRILPARNTTTNNSVTTNNNSSGHSDLRIVGDVVVVKVNETVNNISFAHGLNNETLGIPQCVFWNFNLSAWDSYGCEAKPYISNGNETDIITCECNHTTSFSMLMSPFSIDNIVLDYITYIGVAVSMASLILCIIIEAIVWRSTTRNDTSYMRHVSIINIAISLLIADVCFIIGAAISKEQPTPADRCSSVVFFMHFFYLVLFFWMLISALLLLYRTVMVLSHMSRVKMMIIAFSVSYGAPLLISVITVASTAGPQVYVSKQACWLNWTESKALLAFVIPALTIVAINLVVLIVVLFKLLRRGVGDATQPDEKHTLMVIVRCVAFLTPIFGLTWGFGIGTMVSRELGVHVVFALLNSLQGFFILVFGVLLDSKVREALAGTFSLRNFTSSNRTRSTSAGPSSSSGLGFFQRRRRRRHMYNVSEASALSGPASPNSYSSDPMNA